MSRVAAGRYIEDVPRQEVTHYAWGDTDDIVKVIMAVMNKDDLKRQVVRFSKEFRGHDADTQYRQLKELWKFCRRNIRYQKDPDGMQDIMHPARTWSERRADCKSLTVFIYFVCRALDIPCFIRFASYSKDKRVGHVYPVAVLNGRAVPVDAVLHEFDAEEKPTYVTDRFPNVWDTVEVRQAASESKSHVIGGIGGWTVPKWLKGVIGGLCIIQATNTKGIPRLIYAGAGAVYLAEAFNKEQ